MRTTIWAAGLIVAVVVSSLHPLSALATPPAHLWSKDLGGSSFEYGDDVAFDADGNLFVTGVFQGTANFGGANLTSAGGYDVFLAKYDPAEDGAPVSSGLYFARIEHNGAARTKKMVLLK